MKRATTRNINGNEESDNDKFYNGTISLRVIQTSLLMETLGHKMSLVMLKGSISSPFGLEDPFTSENVEVRGARD